MAPSQQPSNNGYLDTTQLTTIGTGISYPNPFDTTTGGMQQSSGEDRINQSISTILATPKGSRFMNPEFGSDILKALFENFVNFDLVKHYVVDAIAQWESRITISDVQIEWDTSNQYQINISISYSINQTNIAGNYVYPFFTRPYLPGYTSIEGF